MPGFKPTLSLNLLLHHNKRNAELREFERSLGLNKGIGGVKYDQVADRHMDDERYEREVVEVFVVCHSDSAYVLSTCFSLPSKNCKPKERTRQLHRHREVHFHYFANLAYIYILRMHPFGAFFVADLIWPMEGGAASSATFDAFIRMAAGKEGRTLAEKMNDSNRPTWDEYKKKNEVSFIAISIFCICVRDFLTISSLIPLWFLCVMSTISVAKMVIERIYWTWRGLN